MIEYSLFIFIFRILAKFRNWGPKKKNAAAHKWAYFLPPRLSGSAHFFLYRPSQAQKLPAVFLVDLIQHQVVLRTSSYMDLSSSEVTCGSSGGPDPPPSGSVRVSSYMDLL